MKALTLILATSCTWFFFASSSAALTAEPKKEPNLKGKWVNSYSSTAHQSDDPNKKASFVSAITATYRTSELFWLQGGVGFTQITAPAEDFNLVNPEFRGFYRLTDKTANPLMIEIGPTASIPLSSASRKESLLFSIGVAARVSVNYQVKDAGGLLLYYDVGFNRNVHEYESSTLGTINTMNSLNHYFYLEYDLEGPFLVDAWVGVSSKWSYQSVVSNEFTAGQEVLYSVTDWLDASFVHERGGDVLSESGQTYNFGLFDSAESRYSINFTLYF